MNNAVSGNLIRIRFTEDFKPHRAGSTILVSRELGRQLVEELHIAEYHDTTVRVRVVKPLIRQLGPVWVPGAEFVVEKNMVQQYIESGALEIAGISMQGNGFAQHGTLHEPDKEWFLSHDWFPCSRDFAVKCIALAGQITIKEAAGILQKWKSDDRIMRGVKGI